MNANISASEFHRALVGETFSKPPTDDEALCLMLLLHACRIVLSDEAMVAGKVRAFEGITTRHAAEVVASLHQSTNRTAADFYHRWNGDWRAYAVLENPSEEIKTRVKCMQKLIESHPWVERIEDDDWEILSRR